MQIQQVMQVAIKMPFNCHRLKVGIMSSVLNRREWQGLQRAIGRSFQCQRDDVAHHIFSSLLADNEIFVGYLNELKEVQHILLWRGSNKSALPQAM